MISVMLRQLLAALRHPQARSAGRQRDFTLEAAYGNDLPHPI
jgi:hypothetical protein